MSGWVKIPDNWVESDKVEGLGAEAVMLHLSALSLCSRQGSDGHVPRRALRRLWQAPDIDQATARLEAAGEWQPTAVGWFLPNWNIHLLSADEVDRRRELSRVTSERYRRHKAGDHSMCDRCAAVKAGDASRDKSRATSVTSLVTPRLDSTRSDSGEERGESADRLGADAPPGRAEVPSMCVHDRPGGLTYGADGRMACPICDLVAPRRGELASLIEQAKSQGIDDNRVAELADEAQTWDEDGDLFDLCEAVYTQHGGRWTQLEDGNTTTLSDPVNTQMWAYIQALVLLAVRRRPDPWYAEVSAG